MADTDELYFTILHTNDEHSALLPEPFADYHPERPELTRGGFSRLATLVNSVRKMKERAGEPVILVSAGDFMGGSPFSWLAFRNEAAELTLMQELGYDVVTPGNHELDFGAGNLARYLKAAGYPEASGKTAIVSSNIIIPAEHPLNQCGLKEFYIKTLSNGLKLGFFGLFGRDAINVSAFRDDLDFVCQEKAAGSAVSELRKNGADLVIALNHTGLEEDKELLEKVSGIDIIISGHCHSMTPEPILIGGTLVVQALELIKMLGVLELAYTPSTGKLRVRNRETGQPYLVETTADVPEDSHFRHRVKDYSSKLGTMIKDITDSRVSDISQTVALSSFPVPAYRGKESPMGNFITDAMRLKAGETIGEKVDFAFFASGIIRGGLVPGNADFSREKINFFEMADRVSLGKGFDNIPGFPLVSAYFTAREIRRMTEISAFLTRFLSEHYFIVGSGLRVRYNLKRAALKIPLINQLIPTTRGTLSLEVFEGKGIQNGKNDKYSPLKNHAKRLFHVVADYPIAMAIPLVGEKLFYLKLRPKDKKGNPIDLKDAIIYRNGRELKLWQVVFEYALDFPADNENGGISRIPETYRTTTGRFIEV